MTPWKELLGLALLVGTVYCQGEFGRTNLLSTGGSHFPRHFGPGFGTGMTSFGTSGRISFTGGSGLGGSRLGGSGLSGSRLGGSGLSGSRLGGSGLGGIGTGAQSVHQGVSHQDPPEIRRILGSSIHGRPLRMGELGLPRHGGAGAGEPHANGLNNGWDGNPQTLSNQFRDPWQDPFRGGPVPPHFFRHGMMG